MGLKAKLKALAALLPAPFYLWLRRTYRRARTEWSLLRAACHDWRAYRAGSGVIRERRREVAEASLVKNYHRIEKGLALPAPRVGFGRDVVLALLVDIDDYILRYGPGRSTRIAVNALSEYLAFNEAHGHALPDLASRIAALLALHERSGFQGDAGGTWLVTQEDILSKAKRDMRDFFSSRYSVRCFDRRPVAPALIAEAVRMAQKTPSVCNRNTARVYAIEDKELQARLLAYQNGNRGFGDQADKILVVGSSLNGFLTVGERYQAWIDGGMFAMSLVYALHSLGLGSCCLNWSVEPAVDAAFKSEAGLPANLAVVMLLAVGHLPERFPVAQSARPPVDEILQTLARRSTPSGIGPGPWIVK